MCPDTNILLIRLRSIGDILFTLPAIHAIREKFPNGKITFMVSKELAALVEGFRDVDEILPLDRALYRRGNPKAIVTETFALLRRLRRDKLSLAVDFQGYGETALLAWCSGARQRWGSVYSSGRRWAYTRGVTRNDRIHPIEWNLSLLSQCGLPHGKVLNEFALPDRALEQARMFFKAHQLDLGRTTLFIQPFTSAPKKNWLLDNYLALACHWRDQGLQILFGGGPSERVALEPVHRAGFPLSAGEPLLVSGGLMKLSTLVLGGDTGLLHLAVAMGKPVVMVMDSNVSGRTHPFQHPGWAVTPREGRVVASIGIEAVREACARAFLELGFGGVSSKTHFPGPGLR